MDGLMDRLREFKEQCRYPIGSMLLLQLADILIDLYADIPRRVPDPVSECIDHSRFLHGDIWGNAGERGRILEEAKTIASDANWKMGCLSAAWKRSGGTAEEFMARIGLSQEQYEQRSAVWAQFGSKYSTYPHIQWGHCFAAMEWSSAEASECLEWANEVQATVPEMKAWRQAQRGEDLTPSAKESSHVV